MEKLTQHCKIQMAALWPTSKISHWIVHLKLSHFFLNIYLFYWSAVDWQCFRCTARWFSYTYTDTLFLKLFSILDYYKTIVPCAIQWTFVACCIFIRNLAFYLYQIKQLETKCHKFFSWAKIHKFAKIYILHVFFYTWSFSCGSVVKNPPAMQEGGRRHRIDSWIRKIP